MCLTFYCVRGTGPVYLKSRICHVGHSVRLAAATCSFCGQTHRSASEVSPLRLLLSGTHFHMTSARHTSWHINRRQFRSKLKTHLFRQAYNTAWLLWEQFFVEECISVTVTVWLWIAGQTVAGAQQFTVGPPQPPPPPPSLQLSYVDQPAPVPHFTQIPQMFQLYYQGADV